VPTVRDASDTHRDKLLTTMERILAIGAADLASAMQEAVEPIVQAFEADKVDAMFLEVESQTLVALGTSDTPMGRRQHALGLNRLPLANGGHAARAFQTGTPQHSGRLDEDPDELPGLVHGLGVRSEIIAPVDVNGERRGVVLASSAARDAFSEDDLRLLELIGRWVGLVAHRSELNQRLRDEAAERGRRVAADELITVLAHDVKNLLTPLVARIDLLRRRARHDGRERDAQDLDATGRVAQRLGRLASDLLDAARLEGGVFAVNPQPVELVALARETVASVSSGERRVLIRAPDHLEVCLDPDRIRQVLENLLSNAIRHSPEGTPVDILIRTEARDGGEWVILTIRNDGPGVPPELLPRLFTRFTADSRSAGVGLGLYIARQIVELHDGTIAVESTPSQGAEFHVALPLAGPSPAAAQ